MLKKLNQYHYKSYLSVLILFVLAFIFGRNMNVLTSEQKQLQDQTYAQQKANSGIYTISADQDGFTVRKLFLIKKGQCGRIFLDLKNLPTKDYLGDYIYENTKVKVFLLNNFEEKQEIGSYELRNDQFVQSEKIDLCANSDYQDLTFKMDEDNRENSFEISNISFYSLASGKHDLNNLLPPIVGNTDFSKIVYQTSLDSKNTNTAFKFIRHNQIIGQTFIADSDIISGVDMKLEFTGVGGIGNYFLDLREVGEQNGKLLLLPDRIAYYCFNKDSADRDLKIREGIYHIPLAAHLEKGKTYFIGVSNEAVKFNILNTLKMYGGAVKGGQDKIVISIGGKTSEKSGSLYLKTYGAEYVKVGDEMVLTGVKILDNSDGTGSYSYEQKGSFSGYLDLDQLVTKKNTSIFYDNVAGGISARDEEDNTFVYKINTIYPFNKIKIEASQPGGGFTNSLVYYSFDNTNWQEIKNDYDKDETTQEGDKNKFQELLLGDGKLKTIYMKVTYDKEVDQEKTYSGIPVDLFGLKNLKIVANLSLR